MKIQLQFNEIQFQFKEIQVQFNEIQFQFNENSTSIQWKFNFNSMKIQVQFYENSSSIQWKFNFNSMKKFKIASGWLLKYGHSKIRGLYVFAQES